MPININNFIFKDTIEKLNQQQLPIPVNSSLSVQEKEKILENEVIYI